MKDLQREILGQVAARTLSAEEGAARLEALDTEPPTPSTPPPTPDGRTGVKQVRVVNRLGNTEVIGDPGVSYAVAEGPNQGQEEGDTRVIEQSVLGQEPSFEFSRPQGRIRIPRVDIGGNLTVRMNPALPLVTKTQAGHLGINGVKGPACAEVQAGNYLITDFQGAVELKDTAGNLNANGLLHRLSRP